VLGARADCSALTSCTVVWEIARAPVRVYAGNSPTAIDRSKPITKVRDGFEVTVPAADARVPMYFEVVPRRAERGPIVTDRYLRLTGAPNTRDLGGYETRDGKRVRFGELFRTDGLARITDADRARLSAVGLPTTCGPEASADTSAVDDESIRAAAAGVTTRAARSEHSALLRALARDDLPQFVLCTPLDNRTGWAAALILTTLGVPRETVTADYLQSTAGGVPPTQRAYLDAGFEAIRKRYKTFDRYLTRGLGLDDRTYRRLRKRLVTNR
jgi:protein-tyrosine phosphatase